MQYMLMFYETQEDMAAREGAGGAAHMAGWTAYIGSMFQAGIAESGQGLLPPSAATSVRLRGDKRQVQDGPFADTKEQLGGYMILNVPHLDSALEWAARAPCAATGGVEVRPVMPRTAS